jgi:ketosteroid isomerase-like protein
MDVLEEQDMTTTERTDEGKIRVLLGEFTDAIRNKDAAAASALYADDIVVYDLAPPLCIEGPELHDPARIQEWFDSWATPIESKPHRLTIRVGGDIGFAFALQHMTGKKNDGEAVDLWFRATACFIRRNGDWKITHMHNSVPFSMDGSERALTDLKP